MWLNPGSCVFYCSTAWEVVWVSFRNLGDIFGIITWLCSRSRQIRPYTCENLPFSSYTWVCKVLLWILFFTKLFLINFTFSSLCLERDTSIIHQKQKKRDNIFNWFRSKRQQQYPIHESATPAFGVDGVMKSTPRPVSSVPHLRRGGKKCPQSHHQSHHGFPRRGEKCICQRHRGLLQAHVYLKGDKLIWLRGVVRSDINHGKERWAFSCSIWCAYVACLRSAARWCGVVWCAGESAVSVPHGTVDSPTGEKNKQTDLTQIVSFFFISFPIFCPVLLHLHSSSSSPSSSSSTPSSSLTCFLCSQAEWYKSGKGNHILFYKPFGNSMRQFNVPLLMALPSHIQ